MVLLKFLHTKKGKFITTNLFEVSLTLITLALRVCI